MNGGETAGTFTLNLNASNLDRRGEFCQAEVPENFFHRSVAGKKSPRNKAVSGRVVKISPRPKLGPGRVVQTDRVGRSRLGEKNLYRAPSLDY
jgi:hypothetical protein